MHKSYDEMRVLFEINVKGDGEKDATEKLFPSFLNCIVQKGER